MSKKIVIGIFHEEKLMPELYIPKVMEMKEEQAEIIVSLLDKVDHAVPLPTGYYFAWDYASKHRVNKT